MDKNLQQDHYKVKVASQEEVTQYKAGRGAQFNTKNRFLKDEKTKEHIEVHEVLLIHCIIRIKN